MVPRRAAERIEIPVRAGTLAAHRWPADSPGAPLVVAVHGITANGLSWARVADHLAGAVTLVAPDLRGRGASRDVRVSEGIDSHARDVVSVLDALGVDSAVVAGHSMGAFVATRTARMYERRVRSVVLVDGGVGFPAPQGVGTDALLEATIGPAMRRLRMTFASRQAYREYWQAHPALAGAWAPWIDETIQHDLVGTEPELRSSCQLDAIRSDGVRLLHDPEVREAIRLMRVPAVLLWARRGLLNEDQGLYDEQRLANANLDPERVRTVEVPDTNHYLIVYADGCAALVARHISAAAGHAI